LLETEELGNRTGQATNVGIYLNIMKPVLYRAGRVLRSALFIVLLSACAGNPEEASPEGRAGIPEPEQLFDDSGLTLCTRIRTPRNYARVPVAAGSFAEFLRNQPLKPAGTPVRYYDGREKPAAGVYCAVIDRPLRPGDIEQCADAVIRLRAEYLYGQKRYAEIGFVFVHDGRLHRYVDFAGGDRSYQGFVNYLDFVFDHANTVSLYNQLEKVSNLADIRIGDVFIQKSRSINHAIIVMDMAVAHDTGHKIFLLAQSYMPAQETQIIVNPNRPDISPWYSADFKEVLLTPEWRFYPALDLRRF